MSIAFHVMWVTTSIPLVPSILQLRVTENEFLIISVVVYVNFDDFETHCGKVTRTARHKQVRYRFYCSCLRPFQTYELSSWCVQKKNKLLYTLLLVVHIHIYSSVVVGYDRGKKNFTKHGKFQL